MMTTSKTLANAYKAYKKGEVGKKSAQYAPKSGRSPDWSIRDQRWNTGRFAH